MWSCRTGEEGDPGYAPRGVNMSTHQILHQSAPDGSHEIESSNTLRQGSPKDSWPSLTPKPDSRLNIYRPQGQQVHRALLHHVMENGAANQPLGSSSFPPGWRPTTNPGTKLVKRKSEDEDMPEEMNVLSSDGQKDRSTFTKQGKLVHADDFLADAGQIMLPSGSGSSQTARTLHPPPCIPASSVLGQPSKDAQAAQTQKALLPLGIGQQTHDTAMCHLSSKCLAERVSQAPSALVSEIVAREKATEKVWAEHDKVKAKADRLERLLEQHVASLEAATSA